MHKTIEEETMGEETTNTRRKTINNAQNTANEEIKDNKKRARKSLSALAELKKESSNDVKKIITGTFKLNKIIILFFRFTRLRVHHQTKIKNKN